MFELDGNPVTLEFLQEQADAQGMDFDSYLSAMKEKGLVEKQIDSSPETQTTESDDTDSGSGDGSSVLLDRIETGDYDYESGEAPLTVEPELPEIKSSIQDRMVAQV